MTENLTPQVRLLCVDDEQNILSSLRRLFRGKGYEIVVANSGAEGLALLEQQEFDLVISDMRMPVMDGAEFLRQVRERWPDTIRLLLTGFADIDSIIDVINRGEIYRYITKPWDDNDICLIVRQALERQQLEREKQALERLTARQNVELRELNASLEEKVAQRTAELSVANSALVAANEKLKVNFLTSIKVFSNLIELRGGKLQGHSRRVADMARKIAQKMSLDSKDIQQIFVAGLLVDIGKIGLSDKLLSTPLSQMNGEQLRTYYTHCARAEEVLMPFPDLAGAAKILYAQHERYDGRGFPRGVLATNIPLGARILSIASDYDNLQIGVMGATHLPREEAISHIMRGAGNRYDPTAVAAFELVIAGNADMLPDREVHVRDLQSGMVLAADLLSKDGMLLLPAEHMLNEQEINRLLRFSEPFDFNLRLRIYTDKKVPVRA